MRAQYPSHLYIRLDRPLRADLLEAASTQGVTVSGLVRKLLRRALGQEPDGALSAALREPSLRNPAPGDVESVKFGGSV